MNIVFGWFIITWDMYNAISGGQMALFAMALSSFRRARASPRTALSGCLYGCALRGAVYLRDDPRTARYLAAAGAAVLRRLSRCALRPRMALVAPARNIWMRRGEIVCFFAHQKKKKRINSDIYTFTRTLLHFA